MQTGWQKRPSVKILKWTDFLGGLPVKKTYIADIVLLFVAFIWGTTFVVVQNAISFLEPHSFNAVRFFIASILLGLWLIFFRRSELQYFNIRILLSGLAIGFWLFIGYAFQTLGLVYTTSSKAGFITGLSVVLVPLLSLFILKIKPGLNAIIGVCIATIGLYFLTMTGDAKLNIGDLFVFICAIGFAMQIVYTAKFANHFPTLLLTVIQISFVAILSGICAFLFEDWQLAVRPDIIFNQEIIIALLITSFLATAFAFFVQTYFQKHTSATHTALIFSTEPVFAAITGYLFADERMGISGIIGSLFILFGMILAEIPIFMKKTASKAIQEKAG